MQGVVSMLSVYGHPQLLESNPAHQTKHQIGNCSRPEPVKNRSTTAPTKVVKKAFETASKNSGRNQGNDEWEAKISFFDRVKSATKAVGKN